MRAPRCPQVQKSSVEWETWIRKYMEYKHTYMPRHFQMFEEYQTRHALYKESRSIALNNWKYLVYEWLTGRKHHILSFR